MSHTLVGRFVLVAAVGLVTVSMAIASAQVLPKAHVANLIVKVENGVDEFRQVVERRGDQARGAAESPGGRGRRGATESQKAKAKDTKDELDDALGDLNRSTNRLRRKFDATDTWMETKGQVQRVVDDARRINQAMTRGRYGTDIERVWAVLRTGINDLAAAYGIQRLGV